MFDDITPALSVAVRIPADWSASARRMVEARRMTQADIDAVEADLVRFRQQHNAAFLASVDREIALAQAVIPRAKAALIEAREVYEHRIASAKLRPQTTQRTLNVITDEYYQERGDIRFDIWDAKRRIAWLDAKRKTLQEQAA